MVGRQFYPISVVRCFLLMHDTPHAEFSGETTLVIARKLEIGVAGAIAPSLAPLVEWMFRYTWILAPAKRDARAAPLVRWGHSPVAVAMHRLASG